MIFDAQVESLHATKYFPSWGNTTVQNHFIPNQLLSKLLDAATTPGQDGDDSDVDEVDEAEGNLCDLMDVDDVNILGDQHGFHEVVELINTTDASDLSNDPEFQSTLTDASTAMHQLACRETVDHSMATTDVLYVPDGNNKSKFVAHLAKIQSTVNFLNANMKAQVSSGILSGYSILLYSNVYVYVVYG